MWNSGFIWDCRPKNQTVFFQLLSRTRKANAPKESSQQDNSPSYTSQEVAQHNTLEKGIWVTYKGHVYDITEFIANHPGGPSKIVLAAGGALEPFWALYAVHNNQHVLDILEEYHIGSLAEGESSHHVSDIKVHVCFHRKDSFYSTKPNVLLKI